MELSLFSINVKENTDVTVTGWHHYKPLFFIIDPHVK